MTTRESRETVGRVNMRRAAETEEATNAYNDTEQSPSGICKRYYDAHPVEDPGEYVRVEFLDDRGAAGKAGCVVARIQDGRRFSKDVIVNSIRDFLTWTTANCFPAPKIDNDSVVKLSMCFGLPQDLFTRATNDEKLDRIADVLEKTLEPVEVKRTTFNYYNKNKKKNETQKSENPAHFVPKNDLPLDQQATVNNEEAKRRVRERRATPINAGTKNDTSKTEVLNDYLTDES